MDSTTTTTTTTTTPKATNIDRTNDNCNANYNNNNNNNNNSNNNLNPSFFLTFFLSRLELDIGGRDRDRERYMLRVHPSIALDCIIALTAKGYSLHVEAVNRRIQIRVKNKKKDNKHTFQISKEASALIKECTGIDIAKRLIINRKKKGDKISK